MTDLDGLYVLAIAGDRGLTYLPPERNAHSSAAVGIVAGDTAPFVAA